jgi:ATP-dependent protease ClpP protease subunit
MEFIFEQEQPKINLTVWDRYCPIIKGRETVDVYLTEQIAEPATYNELVAILKEAKPYQIVNLYINNGGGVVDSAFYIIDAIKMSEAHVVAHLSGTVASAATIIALSCDDVITTPYLSFMIHNYSSGMQGKGHELKAYQNFTDRELTRAFKDIYKGFLSDEEMERVLDGQDIWLNEIEVAERWGNKNGK